MIYEWNFPNNKHKFWPTSEQHTALWVAVASVLLLPLLLVLLFGLDAQLHEKQLKVA